MVLQPSLVIFPFPDNNDDNNVATCRSTCGDCNYPSTSAKCTPIPILSEWLIEEGELRDLKPRQSSSVQLLDASRSSSPADWVRARACWPRTRHRQNTTHEGHQHCRLRPITYSSTTEFSGGADHISLLVWSDFDLYRYFVVSVSGTPLWHYRTQ